MSVIIKQLLVPYLDYETRCNLRICSKADKALVDSFRVRAHTIVLREIRSDMAMDKTIVRVDIDSFTIWFIGKDNITKVDRAWNGEIDDKLGELREENRYDVAKRFLAKLGRFQADTVVIKNTELMTGDDFQVKCKKLNLTGLAVEGTIDWLSKVKSKLETLEVNGNEITGIGPVLRKIHVSQQVMLVGQGGDFTYEDIEHFEAPGIKMTCELLLPENIKKMMMNYLTKGRREDVFMVAIFLPEDFDPTTLIPEELVYHRKKKAMHSNTFMITGGFQNVHGVQDAREILFVAGFIDLSIPTPIAERKNRYPLWPFTTFDRYQNFY